MGGLEVARRLRQELGAGPTLVTVSGYGRDEHFARSQQAGCVRHFVKPLGLATLQSVLQTLQPAVRP